MGSHQRIRTTRKLDTSFPFYPVKDFDAHIPTDHNRDGAYADSKVGDLIGEIVVDVPCIISGGVVTDAGAGKLNITELLAISSIDEEIQTGVFVEALTRIFKMAAQSNWMDSGADTAGATNYIKVKYVPKDHTDTRDYAFKGGSYNYKQEDYYNLSANTTPPAAGEVCLGEFTLSGGIITGITVVDRSKVFQLAKGQVVVRKNSGSNVGTRSRINFIEGPNIQLTISDDATDDEIDVTITVDITPILTKLTKYRNANTPAYSVAGDSTYRKGMLNLSDISAVAADGSANLLTDQEQVYPYKRVDNRQEDTSGAGYSLLTSLSEAAADKIIFSPTNGLLFNLNQHRFGVPLESIGSGYTHIRIDLHDSSDVQLATAQIAYAALITKGSGWNYADVIASLPSEGANYHFHVYVINFTTGTTPVMSTDSSGTNQSYRQMYFPDGGKFGGASWNDVIRFFSQAGVELVGAHLSTDDDITIPGSGFAGESTGSNYDVMAVDLSTGWDSWEYEDYIGVDLVNGRFKLPSSLNVRDLFLNYNVKETIDNCDTQSSLRHDQGEPSEYSLQKLESSFLFSDIVELEPDLSTSIEAGPVGNSRAVIFPNTGTPTGFFQKTIRNPGQYHRRKIEFNLNYSMSTSNSGVVKLTFSIYINGSLVTTRSETIDPPNDTSREKIKLTNIYIDGSEFSEYDELLIGMFRDNAVGSNHTGKFNLFAMSLK